MTKRITQMSVEDVSYYLDRAISMIRQSLTGKRFLGEVEIDQLDLIQRELMVTQNAINRIALRLKMSPKPR